MSKLSQSQRNLIALYRRGIRSIRSKPAESKFDFTLYLRHYFRHPQMGGGLSKRDFAAIDYMGRRGIKMLEDLFEDPDVKSIRLAPKFAIGRALRTAAISRRAASTAANIEPHQRSSRIPRWAISLVAWAPVALFVTHHVTSIATVTGHSMSPTFNPVGDDEHRAPTRIQDCDIVLLNRIAPVARTFKVGDVVTLYSPSDPNVLITKRILALGGDTVQLWVPHSDNCEPEPHDHNGPHVQSLAYTDIYLQALGAMAKRKSARSRGEWLTIEIPPNYAWVEGDASAAAGNRPENKSRDSREFGPVPLGLLTARVECIVWPPSRFGPPGPRPDLRTGSRDDQNAYTNARTNACTNALAH
ncbi:hypothetical protein MCUN1_001813 [Malassezia cuniculi]|uniref:Mitochondrial inner membrane protease subunit n=1 Tax=Malassezia cuniculi TaxID=948313 RepID=A0AAF0EUQ3_9BASI|nr:hypothetical protein MCUN1_001813 [Malassezia cuniculi]